MSTTNFMTPELNIDDATTSVSGEFVISDAPAAELIDTSNNLNLYVSKALMNQMFLFFSDNTTGNDNKADLSDFSDTDLKYALNVNQWNLKINTAKSDRKHVIKNLLIDLFGVGPADALQNIDVFSNEEELDNDISNIFQTKVSTRQRVNLINTSSIHGSFIHNGTLKTLNHQKLLDASTNNNTSITAKLLQVASNVSQNNTNNLTFRRQFDTTNTSNTEYNLPFGWRTFQFIDGDSISYNLGIKQQGNFFPEWSANANARINGGTETTYRINLIVSTDPSGQTADFLVPSVNISHAENISNSPEFTNIVTSEISGVLASNISSVHVVTPVDQDVLFETNVTVTGISFESISNTTKTNIIQSIKNLYARELNVNAASLLVTLSAGSLKINIQIHNKLLSGITLIGPLRIDISQNVTYIDSSATALNNGIDVTNDLIINTSQVNTSIPNEYNVYFSVSGIPELIATRVVNVKDTIKPIITISGGDVSSNILVPYYDAEATFTDLIGNINVDISYRLTKTFTHISGGVEVTIDNIMINRPDTYTITYKGSDEAGNEADPKTRTVTIVDNIPPVIELNGGDISLNQDACYNELGIMRITDIGNDALGEPIGTRLGIDVSYVIKDSSLNDVDANTFTLIAGVYKVIYTATDKAGNSSDASRNITVIDRKAPVISISGDSNMVVEFGQPYNEPGISSITDEGGDGNMRTELNEPHISYVIKNSANQEVSANTFTQTIGTYFVHYTVTDSQNNSSTVIRQIDISDTVPPNISISGGNLSLNISDLITQPFVDPGIIEVTDPGRSVPIIGSGRPSEYIIGVSVNGGKYALNGTHRLGGLNGNNLNVYVDIGDTIVFNLQQSVSDGVNGHPFVIKTVQNVGSGNQVNNPDAVNNGAVSGQVTWKPTQPGVYYYNCQYHSGMAGKIIVSYITPTVTNINDNTASVNFETFTQTGGNYRLTYTAYDPANNVSDASRNVNITDDIFYIINVNSPLDISVNVGDTFTVPQAEFIRGNDNTGTGILATRSTESIDTTTAGTYYVIYSGTVNGKSTDNVTLTVNVIQTGPTVYSTPPSDVYYLMNNSAQLSPTPYPATWLPSTVGTPFSISAWIKLPTNYSTRGSIVTIGDSKGAVGLPYDGNTSFSLILNEDRSFYVNIWVWNGSQWRTAMMNTGFQPQYSSDKLPNDNAWHHILFTWSGTFLAADIGWYIDGRKITTWEGSFYTPSASVNDAIQHNQKLYIGTWPSLGVIFQEDVQITNFQLWDRVINVNDTGNSVPPAIRRVPFDGGSSGNLTIVEAGNIRSNSDSQQNLVWDSYVINPGTDIMITFKANAVNNDYKLIGLTHNPSSSSNYDYWKYRVWVSDRRFYIKDSVTNQIDTGAETHTSNNDILAFKITNGVVTFLRNYTVVHTFASNFAASNSLQLIGLVWSPTAEFREVTYSYAASPPTPLVELMTELPADSFYNNYSGFETWKSSAPTTGKTRVGFEFFVKFPNPFNNTGGADRHTLIQMRSDATIYNEDAIGAKMDIMMRGKNRLYVELRNANGLEKRFNFYGSTAINFYDWQGVWKHIYVYLDVTDGGKFTHSNIYADGIILMPRGTGDLNHTWNGSTFDLDLKHIRFGSMNQNGNKVYDSDADIANFKIYGNDAPANPYNMTLVYTPQLYKGTPYIMSGVQTNPADIVVPNGVKTIFGGVHNRFGIEVFIKMIGNISYHYILSLRDSTTEANTDADGNCIVLTLNNQRIIMDVARKGAGITRIPHSYGTGNYSYMWNDGLYHHLYFLCDFTDGTLLNCRTYLDGTSLYNVTHAVSNNSVLFNYEDFTRLIIGQHRDHNGYSSFHGGQIANIKFYGQDAPVDTTNMTLTYP